MLNPYATDLIAEMDDSEPGACPVCHYKDSELVYAFGKPVSCTSCVLAKASVGSDRGLEEFKKWVKDFAQKRKAEK